MKRLCVLSILCMVVGCGSDDNDDDAADAAVADASPADAGGGMIAFMDACDLADDQCAEGLFCFNYNAKGPLCTKECTMDAECEAPATGCSMMGVCRAP